MTILSSQGARNITSSVLNCYPVTNAGTAITGSPSDFTEVIGAGIVSQKMYIYGMFANIYSTSNNSCIIGIGDAGLEQEIGGSTMDNHCGFSSYRNHPARYYEFPAPLEIQPGVRVSVRTPANDEIRLCYAIDPLLSSSRSLVSSADYASTLYWMNSAISSPAVADTFSSWTELDSLGDPGYSFVVSSVNVCISNYEGDESNHDISSTIEIGAAVHSAVRAVSITGLPASGAWVSEYTDHGPPVLFCGGPSSGE